MRKLNTYPEDRSALRFPDSIPWVGCKARGYTQNDEQENPSEAFLIIATMEFLSIVNTIFRLRGILPTRGAFCQQHTLGPLPKSEISE